MPTAKISISLPEDLLCRLRAAQHLKLLRVGYIEWGRI